MKDIKVSIIVPVYNGEKYLRQTLRTMMDQSLKEIEIICVDDGSSDNSIEILKELQSYDSRIQLLYQKNQYAGVARNNGLKKAKGKYVVFWDCDDFFEKKALELMYRQCEKDSADLCVCAANRYDSDTNTYIKTGTYLKKEWLPKNVPFSKNTNPRYTFNYSTNVPWNKMWKKSFIDQYHLQFQGIQQSNDTYFSMMSYFLASRVTIVDRPLMSYRINNSHSLTGKASQTIFCSYEAYLKTYHDLKQYPEMKDEVLQAFHNRMLNGLLFLLKSQTNSQSFKEIYLRIQNNLVNDFDMNLNENYYYSHKDYEDFMNLLEYSPEQFLLIQYQKINRNIYTRGNKFMYRLYYSIYYSCLWKICGFVKRKLRNS